VEVLPSQDKHAFDIAVYLTWAVEYVELEFTVEPKNEVSNPIEEQQP
jgi:hypothetical protein